MWIDSVFPWLRPSVDELVTPMNVLVHRVQLVDAVVQLCGWFFAGGVLSVLFVALVGFIVRDVAGSLAGRRVRGGDRAD